MEIPDGWASMLVSAVRDAVLYQEQLLTSQTLRNREDYEEHLMHLSQFFEFVKGEYVKLDQADRIPLDKLL
jgi:hypothetical protein